MQEEIKDTKAQKETEIDLGVFFNLIERIFRKTGQLLSSFFISLFQLFLGLLLFIKRKIVWLALGALIGLGFGLQQYFSHGPSYYSEMIVRANFESARLLYGQIDYFNSLIDQSRYNQLANIFGLEENEARELLGFRIEAVDDDMETARLYKTIFLDHDRTGTFSMDTTWSKTVAFTKFKERLKPYNYPLQKIRLYSTSPEIYNKVQEGLIGSANNNKTLLAYKQGTNEINATEISILQRSLTGLDSLRNAYIYKLEKTGTFSSGNNVIISDTGLTSPEIAMVDKELLLKDELVRAKRKAMEEQEILQVYAGFSPTGTRVTAISRQSYIKYTAWGILITLIILLIIETFKYLNTVEKKRHNRA